MIHQIFSKSFVFNQVGESRHSFARLSHGAISLIELTPFLDTISGNLPPIELQFSRRIRQILACLATLLVTNGFQFQPIKKSSETLRFT
jgi:hypothetical protein